MKYWYDKESDCTLCEPNCVEEWLEMIVDIGYDYDGYGDNVKGLHSLIDEMVDCAKKGLDCLDKNILREDDAIKYEANRTTTFPSNEKIEELSNEFFKNRD